MNSAFIIQARLGSTRFPKKIIRPFYNELSIIELLIKKLSSVTNNIILATSDDSSNDELERIANINKIKCFRGSENDVLERFIQAAEKYNVEKIFRVCSDNPFLDIDEINKLYSVALKSNCDYISFLINGKPSIKTHFGFWCEYVTLKALKRVVTMTSDKHYHEHVTNFIYEYPNDFCIEWLTPSFVPFEGIRLTVDTESDFVIAQDIYKNLLENSKEKFPSTSDVFEYISNNSGLLLKMKNQIKLNSK